MNEALNDEMMGLAFGACLDCSCDVDVLWSTEGGAMIGLQAFPPKRVK